MNDELERRWDDAVETAWREFRQRLADHVAAMADGDSIVVEVLGRDIDGTPAYCQVAAGDEVLRVEAASNVYLADGCQLDDDQVTALGDTGFQQPEARSWEDGETNFWLDLEQREADRAAVMVVTALREVYGVLHPVYLDAGGLEPAREGDTPLHRDRVLTPRSVDDVRAAVDRAVAELYDEAPEWDDDGDLPLPTDERVVWITVAKEVPRILIHCMLLDGVEDGECLLGELNKLNAAEFGLTFLWRGDHVAVAREVPLDAVVPEALASDIARIVTQVDGWAATLRRHLREAQRPDLGEGRGRFAAAYAVMAELEREQRGSVGPAAMVRIYGNDTGLLLKAIRITEQRRREIRSKAREARQQGQRSREKMYRARHDYHRDLASRMRAGLRLMVDAPVRKVQVDQLALFDEDEAGTAR
jgi:hypothetical protein